MAGTSAPVEPPRRRVVRRGERAREPAGAGHARRSQARAALGLAPALGDPSAVHEHDGGVRGGALSARRRERTGSVDGIRAARPDGGDEQRAGHRRAVHAAHARRDAHGPRSHCSVPSTRTAVYSSTGSPRRGGAARPPTAPPPPAPFRAPAAPLLPLPAVELPLAQRDAHRAGAQQERRAEPRAPASAARRTRARGRGRGRRRGRPRETSGRDRPRGGTGERGVERRAGDGTPGPEQPRARARARALGREPSHRVSTRRVRHGRLAARRARMAPGSLRTP